MGGGGTTSATRCEGGAEGVVGEGSAVGEVGAEAIGGVEEGAISAVDEGGAKE
jgi:hypothetical protein